MNILLLGSGGREHAFAWKMAQSKLCTQLFIAPGNPGTAQCGKNINISATDFDALAKFSLENNIEMIVVGPEDPLVKGIWEYFKQRNLKHIKLIGPSKAGAMLEGSKDYAKQFMMRHNIPTAKYKTFAANELKDAKQFASAFTGPVVIKADGLAAGKGVVICPDIKDAHKQLDDFLAGQKFGEASGKVVIEEFLDGIELSVFVLTDGKNYLVLPTAKDYKRIGEGDTGPNTGGMGAISPVPFADAALMKKIEGQIINPTIKGLQTENITYCGFIYFGLIKVKEEPFVIEYNCRLGDPETEVVLPRIENDLVELFISTCDGSLNKKEMIIANNTAVTIVLASAGYPGNIEKGKKITGLNEVHDSIIFHAGTTMQGNDLVTSGGRVMAITSLANSINAASEISKQSAALIQFDGKYLRRDIGYEFI